MGAASLVVVVDKVKVTFGVEEVMVVVVFVVADQVERRVSNAANEVGFGVDSISGTDIAGVADGVSVLVDVVFAVSVVNNVAIDEVKATIVVFELSSLVVIVIVVILEVEMDISVGNVR